MRTLLFIPFIFISLVSFGQVKVDAKATGKHAKVINQAKSGKQKAQNKKQRVRQAQEQLKARKLYRARYDSIKRVSHPKVKKSDSASFSKKPPAINLFSKEDSLAIANEILNKTNFPPEYKDLLLAPDVKPDSSYLEKSDSLLLAEALQVLDKEAAKFMPDELEQGGDPLADFQNPAEGLSSLSPPTKPNPNIVKPDQAQRLFKKIDPDQFSNAQASIQKLKSKYSEMPDTRFPQQGTKRNSLEDLPFKKRLFIGGNVSLQSTDPIILNTNLQLGYWVNKKWMGGVGIILREQFNNRDSTSLSGDGHGYSLFTRYDIPKGFFGWAELERQVNKSLFSVEENNPSTWQSAYLIGVGREFELEFVRLSSMILYDLNFRNNDLNARPWVFRLGINFTKKPQQAN